MKKAALTLGYFYIIFALATVYPNDIVGHNAFFATDFLHNFLNLIIGGALLAAVYWDEAYLPRTFRITGSAMIAIAVLGSWFGGFDIGKIMGFMVTNGADTIVHLVTGILALIFGTDGIRNGEKEIIEH